MTTPLIEDEKEDEKIKLFLASVAAFGNTDLSQRIGNFRGMLYGNDGTGKTIAGLALLNYIVPPDKSIILVDTAENGLSVNNHPALKAKLPDGSPRIIRLPYQGEQWTLAMAATIRRKIAPYDKVGGVQFDEFSGMADSMLANILKYVESKDESRPKDDATWAEYKMLLRKMKNILSTYQTLEGVHVMTIAHFRVDKDGRNLPVESPNFTPSVGRELRKPMHLISNLTVDDAGNRRFQIQPDKGHLAKCKIGGMEGATVDFATLAQATRKWINGEGEDAVEAKVMPRVSATANDSEEPNDESWGDI